MFSTLICCSGAGGRRRSGGAVEPTQECAPSGPRGAFIAFLNAPRSVLPPQSLDAVLIPRFRMF